MQFIEHRRTFRRAAAPLPQGGQFVVANRQFAPLLGKLLLGRTYVFQMRLDSPRHLISLAAQAVEFFPDGGNLALKIGHSPATPLADCRRGGSLAFQAADFVAQRGRGAHLLEIAGAMLFVLAAHLIEPGDHIAKGPFAFHKPLSDRAVQ